ncbi:transmembrane channel-like protein 7 isoform 1-T1 [Polymixia lowei]
MSLEGTLTMDEHKNADYKRLLSDDSGRSTVSEDLRMYYHTEIFDQLPSSQAARGRQSIQSEAPEGSPEAGDKSRGPRDKAAIQPLRDLAMSIQGKREARDRRRLQIRRIGAWESWRRSQSINNKRVCVDVGGAISGLSLWRNTLHTIESRFGVGVKAYFVFLRYLVYLNLLHCVFIWSFILGPTTFYGRGNDSEPLKYENSDQVLDFFLGTGYLGRSPVFYGFYTRGSLNLPCLNTPLLFLAGMLTIISLSLIMVVRRTMVGYKHTWLLGKRYSVNVSYKIFCGWDFTIQDPATAALKHSFIKNDLKLYLEEQNFHLREARRTLAQWARLYLLRIVLNVLVLSLLGGAFYFIFFATERSRSLDKNRHWLVSLFLQYFPPIVMTLVNLILPHIFRKISSFEDYSLSTQVNATLVRSVFLKLASLGIYLFFVLTIDQDNQQCWENRFGREIYKLYVFDFLAYVCITLFLNYPRTWVQPSTISLLSPNAEYCAVYALRNTFMSLWKQSHSNTWFKESCCNQSSMEFPSKLSLSHSLLQERYPSSWPARLSGKQRFLIPFNVLDLVYSQTVTWVGVYYCPLLPFIATVSLVVMFYIKKFTVLRCCVPEQRMFRGSSSSVLFHFMLLLGLLMAAVTLGFNLYNVPSSPGFSLSSSCGPFGGNASVFNVTGACVDNLPGAAQKTIRYLASEAFALPLLLAEIVILTSYVSRGRANQRAIERLKEMLVMSSSDKRFLVKQHATMLRCQTKTKKRCTSGTEEDGPVNQYKDPPTFT